jgi:hypothetical protein
VPSRGRGRGAHTRPCEATTTDLTIAADAVGAGGAVTAMACGVGKEERAPCPAVAGHDSSASGSNRQQQGLIRRRLLRLGWEARRPPWPVASGSSHCSQCSSRRRRVEDKATTLPPAIGGFVCYASPNRSRTRRRRSAPLL